MNKRKLVIVGVVIIFLLLTWSVGNHIKLLGKTEKLKAEYIQQKLEQQQPISISSEMEMQKKILQDEVEHLKNSLKEEEFARQTLIKQSSEMKVRQKSLQDEIKYLKSDLNKSPALFNASSDCSTWLKSCETHCSPSTDSPIPKHVHFISMNRPFSFLEWLAVVSARNKIKPDKITVYTDGLQDSCWWRRVLPFIEHQLVPSMPGLNILNGKTISNWAHKSDFLRLFILYHYGGIYMDTDSLSFASFDALLRMPNQVVLGTECYDRVAVGVMMAQKHNCFICQFARKSCQNFDGEWTTHSVLTMTALMKKVKINTEGLVVLPTNGSFYPMCWTPEGLHQLFHEDFETIPHYNRSDIYAVHLFANKDNSSFSTTLKNIDWIQNSMSLVAMAVRESLPSQFTEQHFNTTECISLNLDD